MKMLSNAATRATKKNLDFDLSLEFLFSLHTKQGGKCSISGCEMKIYGRVCDYRDPFSLSLDRIDSNLGYTRDNVQLVCVWINRAKYDMPQDVFLDLICKLAKRHLAD